MISQLRVTEVRPATIGSLMTRPALEVRVESTDGSTSIKDWIPVTDAREKEPAVGSVGILSSDGARFIPL